MASKIRILITTGDPDGIGWEVTAKALNEIGPRPGVQFIFYRHGDVAAVGPKVSRSFKHKQVTTLFQASESEFDHRTLVEIRSPRPPAVWVEEAAHACLQGRFQALVTAPLSKTSIIEAGLKDIGHTEILARVSRSQNLFMAFLGRKFNVLLMSGHLPLLEAVNTLNANRLRVALKAAVELRQTMAKSLRARPIAIVGVNPHAGELGLIGREEGWMSGVINHALRETRDLVGPLVPDAAFLPQNWKRYSLYVCPYHDQGLIPFKMAHGFNSGVHVTLGLPFVRTSVDHGTAKDIFGKNKAEFGSMKEALMSAIKLVKERE